MINFLLQSPYRIIVLRLFRFFPRVFGQPIKENHNYLHLTIYIGEGYCQGKQITAERNVSKRWKIKKNG